MSLLTQTVKSGDWKNEKHVPEIEAKLEGGVAKVKVSVGSEIEHPNTLEHHISWIKVFFLPEGGSAPVEVGSYELNNHGCLLYTSPSPRDKRQSRMPSSA